MFEKHKEKKMRKLREAEKKLNQIPVGTPEGDDTREAAKDYKKERRRMILRAIAPGIAISFFTGVIIYYLASSLGRITAIGVTVGTLVLGNVMMYFYTKKIYIPAGVDFYQDAPKDPDDEGSPNEIGLWHVPVGLMGSIRKDIPAPLRQIIIDIADGSSPNPNYYKKVYDKDGKEQEVYYSPEEINKFDTSTADGMVVYEVDSFYWDRNTGYLYITPTLYYDQADANVRKHIMLHLQRDVFHAQNAYTHLKLQLPLLVEARVREMLPKALKRMLHAKYDDPGDTEKTILAAEQEIKEEEDKVSKRVRGENDTYDYGNLRGDDNVK